MKPVLAAILSVSGEVLTDEEKYLLERANPLGVALFGRNLKTKKQIWSPKTKSEALKALIKMEELQKNPLAWADLNDPEVVKDSELVEAIRQAKQLLDEIV